MACKRWLKVSCLILSMTFVLSSIPLSLRAEEQSIDCFSVDFDLDFEVEANISASWDTHANLEFVITNTGDDTIHNWFLRLESRHSARKLYNLWNDSIIVKWNAHRRSSFVLLTEYKDNTR